MIAVDTSVAVAAFGEWHRLNGLACSVLDAEQVVLPAHVLLETYSVLTGFPLPHRAPPDLVDAWLEDRFPEVLPPPPTEDQRRLVRSLASVDRIGGAVYDGVVGLSARLAEVTLVTADRRAAAVYEIVGVTVRDLGGRG